MRYRAVVLTADVRFEGWTAEDWQRFLSLWEPRSASPTAAATPAPGAPSGGLFVIHDGTAVRKLLHTANGRQDPPASWPMPLDALAEAYGATWVVAATVGALDEVMERFGARARRQDDWTDQALSLVGIVREMMDEGTLQYWPRRLSGIPTPTAGMVHRALDSVCASGRAVVLGMFKGGELWTAFVGRRRGAAFDVIAGPDELRPAMGVLSGDFRRDYRHLVHAVEDRYAPLSLGCFGEVDTFRALAVDARPGAWTRAVALRDLVLAPVPTAVGLALGYDGARYAYEAVRMLSTRIDARLTRGLLDPALVAVRKRLGTVAGNKDIENVLGFDPVAALRALLRR
jgi:hypothetical protein